MLHLDYSALTPREKQLIDIRTQGFPWKNVADHLGISLNTVKTHVRRISAKLRIHTSLELVSWSRGCLCERCHYSRSARQRDQANRHLNVKRPKPLARLRSVVAYSALGALIPCIL